MITMKRRRMLQLPPKRLFVTGILIRYCSDEKTKPKQMMSNFYYVLVVWSPYQLTNQAVSVAPTVLD